MQSLPRLGGGEGKVWDVLRCMWRNSVRHRRQFICPPNAELARRAEVCIRTVQRCKAKLEQSGHLIVRKRFIKVAGEMRRISDALVVVVTDVVEKVRAAYRAAKMREKVEKALKPMGDSSVTSRTISLYSDKYSPSEKYFQLMSAGLGHNRRE